MKYLYRRLFHANRLWLLTTAILIAGFVTPTLAQSADTKEELLNRIYTPVLAELQKHYFPKMDTTIEGLSATLSTIERIPGKFGVFSLLVFSEDGSLKSDEGRINGYKTDVSLYKASVSSDPNSVYYFLVTNSLYPEYHATFVFKHVLADGEITMRELVVAGASLALYDKIKTIHFSSDIDGLRKGTIATLATPYFALSMRGNWKSVLAIGCTCEGDNGIVQGGVINIVTTDGDAWRYDRWTK